MEDIAQLAVPKGVPDWAWGKIARREGPRWAIAERDASGEVIGTAYRDADGSKTFKPAGKRGLIVAWPLKGYAGTSADQPVFVCEGATDTGALLGLSLDAVGVPMAGACGDTLATLLADRHVVIVADVDPAGRKGAAKIGAVLAGTCASVRIIEPPDGKKDVREAVIAGADARAFAGLAARAKPIEASGATADLPTTAPAFAPIGASALIHDYPNLRPMVIADLLREGETMNVVAAPKIGKSWLVHALALAVVSGREWLGKPTTRGRVLLIDGELHRETLAQRLRTVRTAMGVSDSEVAMLQVWPVRGQRLTIDAIAAALQGIPTGDYRLIVVDALYRFLPMDGEENSNETMTRVYNTLDAIGHRSGAAVVAVHHSAKGDQSAKAVTDVGAGAGSQSRAADTHLILRPHEEEDALVVNAVVRSFPPMNSFVIRSRQSVWTLAPELDATLLRKNNRRKDRGENSPAPEQVREWNPGDFAKEIVGSRGLIRDEVIAAATARGLGKGQAESLFRRALAKNLVRRAQDGPSEPHRFYAIDSPDAD